MQALVFVNLIRRSIKKPNRQNNVITPAVSLTARPQVCAWLRCCLAPERELRPTMEEVAGMLEELME